MLAGRYRLDGVLAAGGMAQVWRGTDLVLERPVAVKVLHPHLAGEAALLQRFRTEAVAAARLNHPGIVAVFDTCSEQGTEAIVMELIGGHTLRTWLDDHGPLTPLRTAEVGARVAEALDAAHRHGLVHRDVKPGNILLCDDGRVLLTDFGIAKLRDETDMTQAGTLLGTVKYLAPEQVEGRPVDARTDVYALGVVLYEAVCGQPPFLGDNATATALARLHRDPPAPSRLRAGIPAALEHVILGAITRDPALRWPDAARLREALVAVQRGQPPPPLPAARPAPAPGGDRPDGSGPAVPPPPPGEHPQDRTPPTPPRRWLAPTALTLLVVGVLAVIGLLLSSTGSGDDILDRIGVGSPEPVPLASVATFDPEGTGTPGEVDGQLGNLVDGDPSTTWRTERYRTRTFGELKAGVGVYATAAEPAPFRQLRVSGTSAGWAASVYVAEEPGDDLAGWGEPVAELSGIDGDAVFDLRATEGSTVLLWITDLGDPTGDPDGRVWVEIGELELTA